MPLQKNWLFPADRGGKLSTMAMTMLLRRMNVDATVHGFRSGFRDWAAECTGYAHEVCEMALAHVIGNKAEAAYRRGDLFEKRRRLMADWASLLRGSGTAGASVTPIVEQRNDWKQKKVRAKAKFKVVYDEKTGTLYWAPTPRKIARAPGAHAPDLLERNQQLLRMLTHYDELAQKVGFGHGVVRS